MPLIPNDNGLILSGNGSRTVAADASDISQISYLESQHLALGGYGSTLNHQSLYVNEYHATMFQPSSGRHNIATIL